MSSIIPVYLLMDEQTEVADEAPPSGTFSDEIKELEKPVKSPLSKAVETNSNGDVEPPPKRRKLSKQERYIQRKEERRGRRKAMKMRRRERRDAVAASAVAAVGDAPLRAPPPPPPPPRVSMAESKCRTCVVLDCAYDHLMSFKDTCKLAHQRRCNSTSPVLGAHSRPRKG